MTDTSPFRRVFDHATARLPQLLTRNSSVIHVWLQNGCDPELDIMPTIDRLAEVNPEVGGFSYFTKAIMRARDERVKAEEVFNPPEVCPVEDRKRAERIAWAVRKAGIRHTQHEAWLEKYEQQHGKVKT